MTNRTITIGMYVALGLACFFAGLMVGDCDKPCYGHTRLQDFATPEALERWLARDYTDEMIVYAFNTGGLKQECCEVYALELIDRAEEEGIRLHFYVMGNIEFYKHYKKALPYRTSHATCLAIIGNEVWLIEPQTDEIWLKAYLD